MVMQSEFVSEFLSLLFDQSFVSEIGESSSNDYTDNSLDTVHISNVSVDKSKTDNYIYFSFDADLGSGNGNDLNSFLLKMNDKAVSKILHTTVNKTDLISIHYKFKLSFVPLTG